MATANNSACGNLLNDLTFRRYSQTFKKYVESILEKLTNLSKTYGSDCRRDMENIKRFVNDCLGWEDELRKVYEEMNWKNFIEKRMRDENFQNEKLEMQLKLKELQLKIQSQENEIKNLKGGFTDLEKYKKYTKTLNAEISKLNDTIERMTKENTRVAKELVRASKDKEDIEKNHLFVLQLTKKDSEDEKKKLSKTIDDLRSRMTDLWNDEKKRYQEMEQNHDLYLRRLEREQCERPLRNQLFYGGDVIPDTTMTRGRILCIPDSH